ncbi:MAG TPA: cytochrome c [Thermoanaerobaculia bacterium]|jgi:high-affinity iron transporter
MSVRAAVVGLLGLCAAVACHRASVEVRQAAAPAVASAISEAPAGAPVMPMPQLGYGAREGRALFLHYCSTCHGVEGHGDGFNAYNLDPKPRDLGDPDFQARQTDDELASVIRSGGAAAGLSTGMPPWGKTLRDRQIRHLVSFLRTLTPEEE